MTDDDQNFVVFGEPFDEDDDGMWNFINLILIESTKFLNPKSRPQAYEQRVLNERGRPMRFHGAFTGGFSAGYFNTVGSKEGKLVYIFLHFKSQGFQPQTFKSSRRNRTQNADKQQAKPEDFMDEEVSFLIFCFFFFFMSSVNILMSRTSELLVLLHATIVLDGNMTIVIFLTHFLNLWEESLSFLLQVIFSSACSYLAGQV